MNNKTQDFEDGLALVTKDNDTYFINGLGQIAFMQEKSV